MTRAPSRRSVRGFTLVELLAYLAIFGSMTATMLAAESAARKLNRFEAAGLDALYQADRIFAAIGEDCDRATALSVAQVKSHLELRFSTPEGGAVIYAAKDGELVRGRSSLASFAKTVRFERPDPEKHPRLLKVTLGFERRLVGRDEVFTRTYERTFLVRNLEGDHRGGL